MLLNKLINVPRDHSLRQRPKDFTQVVRERYRQTRSRLIDKENQSLESRVKCSKTNYPLGRYLREREQTEKYLSIMSRFRDRAYMWMRNSPGKLKPRDSRQEHPKFREVAFERLFNKKLYRVEGYLRCSTVEILIRNKQDDREKHDISLDLEEGVRVVDSYFDSSFRKMLEAVQYDSEQQQFYIKLPE